MCNSEDCIIYFFLLIIVGFTILIYFLLKYREILQKKNLEVGVEEVWASVSERAEFMSFQKKDMLFCVWKDETNTKMSCLVKDSKGEIVGQIFNEMGSRMREIKTGGKVFIVKFPFTWHRSAILYELNNADVIATYQKKSWFQQHEFQVGSFGVIKSKWLGFNSKLVSDYIYEDKVIGTSQLISSSREKGRLIIMGLDLPLEVRLFMLSV